MKKTKARPRFAGETCPVLVCRLKKNVGSNDVGLDERCRAINRAVDMRFRRQMDHRIWLKFAEQLPHSPFVADINTFEGVSSRVCHRIEGIQVSCIRQL